MKKLYGIILVVLTLVFMAGCKPEENELVIDNAFYDAGLNHTYLIYDHYYHAPGYFSAYDPADTTPGSEYAGTAALWDYGAVMTMLAAAANLNPNLPLFKEKIEDVMEGLKKFRMPRTQLHYSAIVGAGGEPYYDDNAWVVLALYDLAKAYDDDELMAHSRELLDYVLSGESEDGGIYWKETVSSRNTCSSGPMVVAAVLHYLENPEEEQELLEAAIRVYNWTKTVLRDPSDNVYWDNAIYDYINDVEQVEKWKFTYNSGTMIWAGVLLHQATNEMSYRQDAIDTALGAFGFYYQPNKDGRYFYPRTPWFNLYLLRGFIELAKSDESNSYDYLVNSFKTSLRYGLVNGTEERGFILPTWGSGENSTTDKFLPLLETVASTEMMFLLADWEINHEKGDQ